MKLDYSDLIESLQSVSRYGIDEPIRESARRTLSELLDMISSEIASEFVDDDRVGFQTKAPEK